MEELTIEEKAGRYDAAVEKMREIIIENNGPVIPKELGEHLFPELEDSEKWISEEIINYFKEKGDYRSCWISWIKKQGENKSSVKKIEPKFKPGDWITCGSYTFQITSLDNKYYWSHNNTTGGDIESINKHYHLWTIKDAKAGDVLVSDIDQPFIFNGRISMNDAGLPMCGSYCGIDSIGYFVYTNSDMWTYTNDVMPADKDQCDFLFSEIRKAHYKWNAEELKLEEIEADELKCEDT